jgi:predicted GNAT family acetyltransferase
MSDIPIFLEDLGDRRGRYLARVDGAEAELTFQRRPGGVLVADHTGTPQALEGRGVASALVRRLVADARALGLKIVPACSFVEAQFRRHPEWADLRA